MIAHNIEAVHHCIQKSCIRCNRDPSSIAIVVASKGRTVGEIKEVISAGLTQIGENKVQEALIKYAQLLTTDYGLRTKWHMIGHLQTNKAKDAVRIFDLIQSVDSLRLAQEIDYHAAGLGKVQDILVEVNISGEKKKFGVKPEDALEVVKSIAVLKNIRIQGLMTMAPVVESPEKARPYFRIARELLDKMNKLLTTDYRLRTISMGMSDDFEVAIEEGSTMIRLGRAVFEGRPR